MRWTGSFAALKDDKRAALKDDNARKSRPVRQVASSTRNDEGLGLREADKVLRGVYPEQAEGLKDDIGGGAGESGLFPLSLAPSLEGEGAA